MPPRQTGATAATQRTQRVLQGAWAHLLLPYHPSIVVGRLAAGPKLFPNLVHLRKQSAAAWAVRENGMRSHECTGPAPTSSSSASCVHSHPLSSPCQWRAPALWVPRSVPPAAGPSSRLSGFDGTAAVLGGRCAARSALPRWRHLKHQGKAGVGATCIHGGKGPHGGPARSAQGVRAAEDCTTPQGRFVSWRVASRLCTNVVGTGAGSQEGRLRTGWTQPCQQQLHVACCSALTPRAAPRCSPKVAFHAASVGASSVKGRLPLPLANGEKKCRLVWRCTAVCAWVQGTARGRQEVVWGGGKRGPEAQQGQHVTEQRGGSHCQPANGAG